MSYSQPCSLILSTLSVPLEHILILLLFPSISRILQTQTSFFISSVKIWYPVIWHHSLLRKNLLEFRISVLFSLLSVFSLDVWHFLVFLNSILWVWASNIRPERTVWLTCVILNYLNPSIFSWALYRGSYSSRPDKFFLKYVCF